MKRNIINPHDLRYNSTGFSSVVNSDRNVNCAAVLYSSFSSRLSFTQGFVVDCDYCIKLPVMLFSFHNRRNPEPLSETALSA